MASFTYNTGSLQLQNGTIVWSSATIKLALIGIATPYTGDQTDASMTAAAASELSVTGYIAGFAGSGRQTLAGKTLTDAGGGLQRTVYNATSPAAWTLSTGGTVASAIVYAHITSDALSIPLFFLDFTDVPTNGSTFTLTFNASGIAYTQQ